jgi:prevent-host-death family protein
MYWTCGRRFLPAEAGTVDLARASPHRRGVFHRCATFMYMSNRVGVAELRRNLSRYLRRVERGERLLVTDRNRPVAELGPPATTGAALDRLLAEGRVSRPARRGLPGPLHLSGDPHALSRALDEVRGER